jgi:hypothetical protein
MTIDSDQLRKGEQVMLLGLPPDFLNGLPEEDQRAITAMVGKPVTFLGYDEIGSVELHFEDPFRPPTDESSYSHSIWVRPEFIRRIQT